MLENFQSDRPDVYPADACVDVQPHMSQLEFVNVLVDDVKLVGFSDGGTEIGLMPKYILPIDVAEYGKISIQGAVGPLFRQR